MKPYGKARLPGSRLSYEDDVLRALNEGEAGQGPDLGAVDIGLALKGEGLKGPRPGDLSLL